MKKTLLVGTMAAALLVNAACGGAANTANTTNTANANKPANSNTAVVVNNNSANVANTANTANTTSSNATSNSAPRTAGGKQDFKLINDTGVEIHAVYVAPSDSTDWEEDILGKDTLASGENVEITFDRAEKAPKWDLRVEDKDGNFIVWDDLDLTEISEVTLNYKDKKATATVK